MPPPAGYEEVPAPKGPPQGYEEVAPPKTALSAPDPNNPAGSIPDPKQDILSPSSYRNRVAARPLGRAGEAEEAMGEGRGTGEILKDASRPPAIGASTVAPMMTGGMSIPVQMAVGGASGYLSDRLEGGDNGEALTSGAIGAAIPSVGPIARGIGGSRAGRAALGAAKAAAGRIPVVGPMGKAAIRGGLQAWRESAPTIDALPESRINSGRLALPAPETPPDAPSGRLVLTPAQAQAEEKQLALAKRMASQRGMQYAAGMKPKLPSPPE